MPYGSFITIIIVIADDHLYSRKLYFRKSYSRKLYSKKFHKIFLWKIAYSNIFNKVDPITDLKHFCTANLKIDLKLIIFHNNPLLDLKQFIKLLLIAKSKIILAPLPFYIKHNCFTIIYVCFFNVLCLFFSMLYYIICYCTT